MITPKSVATLPPSLQVAYTLCNAGKGSKGIPFRIMNTSNTDIELFSGQKIADFYHLIDSVQCPFSDVYYVCSSSTERPTVEDELKAALSN